MHAEFKKPYLVLKSGLKFPYIEEPSVILVSKEEFVKCYNLASSVLWKIRKTTYGRAWDVVVHNEASVSSQLRLNIYKIICPGEEIRQHFWTEQAAKKIGVLCRANSRKPGRCWTFMEEPLWNIFVLPSILEKKSKSRRTRVWGKEQQWPNMVAAEQVTQTARTVLGL